MDPIRHSAPLEAREEREFVPFVHELVATAFAAIQPLFLSGVEVAHKADESPVTLADRLAEERLRELLSRRYPDHGVLGEEFGERPGGAYRWVLDPIDGTRAFITNCFLFGTLIALERDDGRGHRPVLGCIAHAAAGCVLIGHGGGTTLYRGDGSSRPARVRAHRPLSQATVLTTTPAGSPEQGADARVARVTAAAGMSRTWGDCFGYFALATGGADAMIDPQLSLWDLSAVVPVVEGAGGRVSAWPAGDPFRSLSLLATTGALHEEIGRAAG